jgi:hypothetical protein
LRHRVILLYVSSPPAPAAPRVSCACRAFANG